jgi:hypothetical protein
VHPAGADVDATGIGACVMLGDEDAPRGFAFEGSGIAGSWPLACAGPRRRDKGPPRAVPAKSGSILPVPRRLPRRKYVWSPPPPLRGGEYIGALEYEKSAGDVFEHRLEHFTFEFYQVETPLIQGAVRRIQPCADP